MFPANKMGESYGYTKENNILLQINDGNVIIGGDEGGGSVCVSNGEIKREENEIVFHSSASSLISIPLSSSSIINDNTPRGKLNIKDDNLEEERSKIYSLSSSSCDVRYKKLIKMNVADENIREMEEDISKEVKNASIPIRIMQTVLYICLWYCCSLFITALDKIVFDSLAFNYPIFVTFIHFSFMSLYLKFFFCCCAEASENPTVSTRRYLTFILPISFCAAGEVALTNESYSLVSLGVMTVIRSSAVVFTYLGGVLMGLEKFSWKLLFVVLFIITSKALTLRGMEIRSYFGILYLMLSVLLTSTRWVIAHHQLNTFSSLQLMLLVQPLSAVILSAPAAAIDVRNMPGNPVFSDPPRFVCVVILVSFTTILAFCLTVSEYRLVDLTSSLSLFVVGIGKEIITIFMSMIEFKEHLDLQNWIGISLSVVGVLIYSRMRYSNMKKVANVEARQLVKDTT